MTPPRSRVVYAVVLVAIVAAGLASRRFGPFLPSFVATYAGDTLWASMIYVGLGLLFPRAGTRTLAVAALAFAVADEISQLYHAPWIDAIRGTRLGALVLGYGFLWSDLACYAAGVVMAACVDMVLHR